MPIRLYSGSAASIFTSIAALPLSAFHTAKNISKSSDRTQHSQTHATPSKLTDPGIQRAPLVKAQILNLLQLLAGSNASGSGTEPDWNRVSGSRGTDTGAYIRYALQVSKESLDPQKQFSADLIQAIDNCLPVRRPPGRSGTSYSSFTIFSTDHRQSARPVAVRGCGEHDGAPTISRSGGNCASKGGRPLSIGRLYEPDSGHHRQRAGQSTHP